jgi:pimeloyl-ACP methyl ester carboxylesterase
MAEVCSSRRRTRLTRHGHVAAAASSIRTVPFLLLLCLWSSLYHDHAATALSSIAPPSSLNKNVAVLGVGDLRLHDRSHADPSVSAFAILLTDENIRNMPSARTHTIDTVALLHAAYTDIERRLEAEPSLAISYCESVAALPAAEQYHVCDLGPVDNAMGYGAYSAMLDFMDSSNKISSNNKKQLEPKLRLWNDHLRTEPWQDVAQFQGGTFPDYERRFVNGRPYHSPSIAMATTPTTSSTTRAASVIPSMDDLLDRFLRVLDLSREVVEAEANTGLYATHWGGLDPATVMETNVLGTLSTTLVSEQPLPATANAKSLEHQSILWQAASAWMIPGEATVRFLAAPLLLGTVSQRRLRQLAQDGRHEPLRNLLEGREWHKLLAAAAVTATTSTRSATTTAAVPRYWRWHGFLCRYMMKSSTTATASSRTGNMADPALVLVHGFGASATQWLDVMQESPSSLSYAPDQLGFGHAEKPGLSYTAYAWDAMLTDFCKEIVTETSNTYVAAGNSIGGFTSLSLAASDAAQHHQWSSNGAPGANKCVGLVLCNSAGNIVGRDQAESLTEAAFPPPPSIAKMTATRSLPPCRPPPRFVARAFGNFILSQLRPRIPAICRNLYPVNPNAVDEALCADIERDSLDPGAIHVMMSGSKLPPPRTANELLRADFASGNADEECVFTGPVLIAQGILDPLNKAEDRMNMYGALRSGITMHPIQAGHCPHDEVPQQVARAIESWMQSTVLVRVAATASTISNAKSAATFITAQR